MSKSLGKIVKINLGFCGHNEDDIGIQIIFKAGALLITHEKGFYDINKMDHNKRCEWTEAERSERYSNIIVYTSNILRDAGKNSISELVGVPVELTFDKSIITDWRVLTEVL